MPSRITTSARPCDSPAVRNRSIRRAIVYEDFCVTRRRASRAFSAEIRDFAAATACTIACGRCRDLLADRFLATTLVDRPRDRRAGAAAHPAAGSRGEQFAWTDAARALSRLRHPLLNRAGRLRRWRAPPLVRGVRGAAAAARQRRRTPETLVRHAARFSGARHAALRRSAGARALRPVRAAAVAGCGPAARHRAAAAARRSAARRVARRDATPGGATAIVVRGGAGARLAHAAAIGGARWRGSQGYVPVAARCRAAAARGRRPARPACCVLAVEAPAAAPSAASPAASPGSAPQARGGMSSDYACAAADRRPRRISLDRMGVTAMIGMVFAGSTRVPSHREICRGGAAGRRLARRAPRASRARASRRLRHAMLVAHEAAPATPSTARRQRRPRVAPRRIPPALVDAAARARHSWRQRPARVRRLDSSTRALACSGRGRSTTRPPLRIALGWLRLDRGALRRRARRVRAGPRRSRRQRAAGVARDHRRSASPGPTTAVRRRPRRCCGRRAVAAKPSATSRVDGCGGSRWRAACSGRSEDRKRPAILRRS